MPSASQGYLQVKRKGVGKLVKYQWISICFFPPPTHPTRQSSSFSCTLLMQFPCARNSLLSSHSYHNLGNQRLLFLTCWQKIIIKDEEQNRVPWNSKKCERLLVNVPTIEKSCNSIHGEAWRKKPESRLDYCTNYKTSTILIYEPQPNV